MLNGPPEHRTVQTVIYFIGACALLLVLGDITLVAIVLASGRDVAPAAVALIAGVSGLAGTALGSLGSLLVSTRPGAAPGDPTTFTAPADASVTVKPADPEQPAPDDPREGLPLTGRPAKKAPATRVRRTRAAR